ncbi:MAG: hypothetical protein OXT74_12510 [Candidatus Poribacteria bacterium]|nr:hypothetical protein [Candidatus Poribacteria bacterium]
MKTENDKIKISDEDHAEAIRRRVYDGWTTSRIVDSWIEKYPEWNHIERKKFRDASLLSNPASTRFSKKWREIYVRHLANFNEERSAVLQAAAGKTSSVILELVEKVRRGVQGISVDNANDLLTVARAINTVKDVALHETEKSINGHNHSIRSHNHVSSIDRLRRHRRLDRGTKKTE